jgi:hypothetical protein
MAESGERGLIRQFLFSTLFSNLKGRPPACTVTDLVRSYQPPNAKC